MVKRRQPPTAQSREQQLQEIWDQLPTITCQGLCADSCCSMWQTTLEQQIIQRRTGRTLPLIHAGSPCTALTILRRCSIYEHRPLICRLWGMTASMRCDYGCIPEGGFLTDRQAYELIAQVAELAGDHEGAEQIRAPFRRNPEAVERFLRAQQKNRDLDWHARATRPDALQVLPGGQLERRNR